MLMNNQLDILASFIYYDVSISICNGFYFHMEKTSFMYFVQYIIPSSEIYGWQSKHLLSHSYDLSSNPQLVTDSWTLRYQILFASALSAGS